MKEVETIDKEIRKRSNTELRRDIDDACRPILDLMKWSYPNELPKSFLRVEQGNPVSGAKTMPHVLTTYEALDAIKDQIFEALKTKREDEAITNFLESVENFRKELNELKEGTREA